MKLLIVANYAKEHINKFHLSTIAKFREEGWQVDVACNADAPIPGANHVFHLPAGRNPYHPRTLRCIRELKKILAENAYDAIHCHTPTGQLVGVVAAECVRKRGWDGRLIITFHGLHYYKGSSALSKLLIPTDKYITSHADYVFSVNREDLDFMRNHGYQLKQSSFCPPSVNFEKYADAEAFRALRTETRQEFGLTDEYLVLTYVAELNENKNQTLLLDALVLLKQKLPNVRLLLIGPDHSDGKMQRAIEKRGLLHDVILTGWRDDVCRLLSACDIYTASSIREGFGVNLIEASLCGLPVIATDNRGHREIISDGKNGYLVPLKKPSALAERVLALASDAPLRVRLVQCGGETITELFGEKTEDAIFNVYRTLFDL